MGIEDLNEIETFYAIIEAINTQNDKDLNELVSHARKTKFKRLPTITDDNGNTILHYLMMQGSSVLMKEALGYEVGYTASFGVKNKEGKTPHECMLDLPAEKQEFKNQAESYFAPKWNQGYILQQFQRYLAYQQKQNPEQYKEEDIKRIIDTLKEGHCNGIASIWLQGWIDGKENQYQEIFHDIVYWNYDKPEETLTPELVKKFEYAIQLTRSYHINDNIFAGEKQEYDRQRIRHLYGEDQQESQISNDRPKRNDLTLEQIELFEKAPDLNVPWNALRVWEEAWDPSKYKSEKQISSLSISLDGINFFLKSLARPENEGKGFSIFTRDHALAGAYRNGQFYLFDSNFDGDEEGQGVNMAKSFNLVDEEERRAAVHELRKCGYENFGRRNLSSFQIAFKPLGKKDMNPGKYITLHTIELLESYMPKVKSGVPLDPVSFVENIESMAEYFSREDLKYLYDHVVFNHYNMNELSSDLEYKTPLLALIEKGNYPDAVKALLRSGADPLMDCDGVTPLSAAQEQPRVLTILQGNSGAQEKEQEVEKQTLPHKLRVQMSVVKIPANFREENISAVFSILNNDELVKTEDGSIPDIIKEMRTIVEDIDYTDEKDIAQSIIEIKDKIKKANGSNWSGNVQGIIDAFSSAECCDFQAIRARLHENPAFDVAIVKNKGKNL